MLSGLMFSQPFNEANGNAQPLSPPFGTKAWDAATRSPVINRAGRMTVGPPGAVWEANNSMVWQQKPLDTLTEQGPNSDSRKRLSQRPRLSRSQQERGRAHPAQPHKREQDRMAWREVSSLQKPLQRPRPKSLPETPCAAGSRNGASTRQRGRGRRESWQT